MNDVNGFVSCVCDHSLISHDRNGWCQGTYGLTAMYCPCRAYRTPEQARVIQGLESTPEMAAALLATDAVPDRWHTSDATIDAWHARGRAIRKVLGSVEVT